MKVVVLLFLLCGIGFGAQRPEGLPADVTEQELRDVVITFDRSECFGPCPIYVVEIHGDGTVNFKGIKYVKAKGERHYKIPVAQVRELVAEFYKADFFALKDEYTSIVYPDGFIEVVTDLPGKTVSIRLGKRTKSVYDYYGTPPQVRRLEQKIDEVSGVSRFMLPAK